MKKYTINFTSYGLNRYEIEYESGPNNLRVYAKTGDVFCDVANIENSRHLFNVRNILNGESFIIHIYPSRSSHLGLYIHIDQKILRTIVAFEVKEKQD